MSYSGETLGELIKAGRRGASSEDAGFRKHEKSFRWKLLRGTAKDITGKKATNATVKSIARNEEKKEKIWRQKHKMAEKMRKNK